jgi:CIC family chloride channel protein
MYLIIVAGIVGCFAGVGAVVFGWMVRMSEVFFYDKLIDHVDILGKWIYLLPLIPAIGGLIVGMIQTWLVPEAKGPGVPAVVYSLVRKGGLIPFRIGVTKAITAAISIGSGGSAGTEAPIIHIGSTLGSVTAKWLRVPSQHMSIIVASGAAAALGAIFNAPIAGVLFALEIFLQDISYKTFTPVVIASVTASSLARSLTDKNIAMFAISPELTAYHYEWYELIVFAILGIVSGLISVLFVRFFYATGKFFKKLKFPEFLKPAAGTFALGVLGLIFILCFQERGHQPAIFGNGYGWIRHLLNPHNYGMEVEGLLLSGKILMLLFVLKMVATSLTLGSGSAGGEFGPVLFLGAVLGSFLAMGVNSTGIIALSNPAIYAIVGMAGFLAGTTHAPLMAILLLFEITSDYALILPIMISAVLSTTCAQILDRDSIYSRGLNEMGIRMGGLADLTILRKITIDTIATHKSPVIHPTDPLQTLLDKSENWDLPDFIVTDEEGRYAGMVSGEDIRTALLCREAIPLLVIEEIAKPYPVLHPYDTLETALNTFSQHNVDSLPVASGDGEDQIVSGLLTRNDLMKAYQQALSNMRK